MGIHSLSLPEGVDIHDALTGHSIRREKRKHRRRELHDSPPYGD